MRQHLALAILALAAICSAQTTGAVFTTNRNGSQVDGNQYQRARDVYFTAGPGPGTPCTGPGLPDGNYYFQVTDPSGQFLLSEDHYTNREIVVAGGVIAAHTGTHATGRGPCGSLTVQLLPFGTSPNGGNEYKVWVTPAARYDLLLGGAHGFHSRYSKTDNFKVRSGGRPTDQSIISGFKFYDHSEDGIWNPGLDPLELPIPGWRIEILRNGQLDGVTFTDESGRYVFLRDRDGSTWTIREVAPGGFIGDGIPGAVWLAMTPREGTVITDAENVPGPDFGNIGFEVKVGVGRTKGFWHNQNGRDLLAACDPHWREVLTVRRGLPLCLRRPISTTDPTRSIFVPLPVPAPFADAHLDFAEWIVGLGAEGHAGFILSTQVAAAVLNRECGFMQFTAYIDRFQNGVLVSFEDMIAGVTGLLCDPLAGLTGPNDPPSQLRDTMLACINEFGGINNTGDVGEPQVVYGPSDDALDFGSPY